MAVLPKVEPVTNSRAPQERGAVNALGLPGAADPLVKILPALFALAFAAVIAATVFNLALGFDGSYYLVKLLDEGTAYVPHHRIANYILQFPPLAARALFDQLTPALVAFNFTYSAIGFFCLLACYLMVRKHNTSLIMWPALAICLISTVLTPMLISEILIASEIAWPLLIGVITPPNKFKTAALVLTAVFLATLHPCSIFYLGVTALVVWRYGYGGKALTNSTVLTLLAIAGVRLACAFLFPVAYETDTLSTDSWINYLFRFVVTPLLYVEMYAIVCGVLFITAKKNPTQRIRLLKISVGVMLLASAIAFLWSGEIKMLDHCFFAGRFIFIPTAVLMICAALDGFDKTPLAAAGSAVVSRYRYLLTTLAFLGILGLTLTQCATFLDVKRRVQSALDKSDSAVIDIDAKNYPYGTPLAHWSIGSYSIIMQGRQPEKVMVKSQFVQPALQNGVYTINVIEPPLSQKWFKLPPAEIAGKVSQ